VICDLRRDLCVCARAQLLCLGVNAGETGAILYA
jgi:hypothetical protein